MDRWKVRLSNPAEHDYGDILVYTAANFGGRQAQIYEATLRKALTALTAGPAALGSVARDDLGPGIRTLHVARRRRRGRHIIIYREAPGATIEVLRVLHDAMDLAQHVPTDE